MQKTHLTSVYVSTGNMLTKKLPYEASWGCLLKQLNGLACKTAQ